MTLKEVSDRLDNFIDSISEKLDTSTKELRTQIDGAKDLANSVRHDLSADIAHTNSDVAHIKGTLSTTKLIGGLFALVLSAVTGAGISNVWSEREKLKEQQAAYETLAEKQKALVRKTAALLKSEYIDQIETDYASLGSLDALQNASNVLRIDVE